jgi:hypothetical protein
MRKSVIVDVPKCCDTRCAWCSGALEEDDSFDEHLLSPIHEREACVILEKVKRKENQVSAHLALRGLLLELLQRNATVQRTISRIASSAGRMLRPICRQDVIMSRSLRRRAVSNLAIRSIYSSSSHTRTRMRTR